MWPVGVAEDDRVGVREPTPQVARQPAMRPVPAEAQRPEERVRLLEPAAAIAMHDDDPFAFDLDLSRQWKVQPAVVVSTHRLDVRDPAEGLERLQTIDISCVNDHVDPPKYLEEARGKLVYELGAVRVRDDTDAFGHAEQLSCPLNLSILTLRLDKLVSQAF